MNNTLRQAAADAFNLLVYNGKLDKSYLYNFIEDNPDRRLSTRAGIEKMWREQGLEIGSYSPFREYVMLWKEPQVGKGHFADVRIIEVREFVQSAQGLAGPGKRGMMS